MTRYPLAVAGESALGALDEFGYVHLQHGWRVEWWIAGDDYWHVPAGSPSLRQRSVEHTPVVETAMRVPGGDVVWRAAAAATSDGGAIVAELENRASVPVAIGVALVAPTDGDDPLARPSLHFTAPARSVAAEMGVELLVHPVTHGSTFRCSIGTSGLEALPPIDAIVRGWQTLARQGAQIDVGEPTRNEAVAAARTSLLLHAGGLAAQGKRADRAVAAEVASALTLLGHEDEAATLRLRARLKPRRRGLPLVGDITPELRTDPLALIAAPSVAARAVAAVRSQLVDDSARKVLNLLPVAAGALQGRSVDIANLPTNAGPVSFALRWHGDKPALLWEAPAVRRLRLRAPALDPTWITKEKSGEALLGVAAHSNNI